MQPLGHFDLTQFFIVNNFISFLRNVFRNLKYIINIYNNDKTKKFSVKVTREGK